MNRILKNLSQSFAFMLCLSLSRDIIAAEPLKLEVTLNATKSYQTVDGFGVNFNPAQWRDGNLESAINLLVDDLGCSMIRFDPTGLAEWLDPSRRDAYGTWPKEYLKEVYTSKMFHDAWASFRALNVKGIEPFFNISGRIPAGLGRKDNPRRLADFDGYAEMLATMLQWARKEEGLRFRFIGPFNETDYGFPEGPRLETDDLIAATDALLKKLDAHKMADIQLILADDSQPSMERTEAILKHPEWKERVRAFGLHTYGDGDEVDASGWNDGLSPHATVLRKVQESSFNHSAGWMTEYGDLDLSGIIENEIGWRSTRRLLKFMNEGYSAGLIWDGFDNLHKHDNAWSTYGILSTDTNHWTYTPKPRYFAARQMFRFVRPGFVRIAVEPMHPPANQDPYAGARDPFRHLLLSAFVYPDRSRFTFIGMNRSEKEIQMTVSLKGIQPGTSFQTVNCFTTSSSSLCQKTGSTVIKEGQFTLKISPNSIFTMTTYKPTGE